MRLVTSWWRKGREAPSWRIEWRQVGQLVFLPQYGVLSEIMPIFRSVSSYEVWVRE